VRSNSASRSLYTVPPSSPLSFFDSPPPPPPSSRPGNPNLIVSSRLAAEVKAELENQSDSPSHFNQNATQSQSHSTGPPPYSLALTSGQSDSAANTPPHLRPFFLYPAFAPAFTSASTSTGIPTSEPATKRQRVRYHLDVGAYGIPKRSHGASVAGRDGQGRLGASYTRQDRSEHLSGAVQVGEDAYFVRDNAMGVADGVGGWSRLRRHAKNGDTEPSPSALFARRLMHFCSEEVEASSSSRYDVAQSQQSKEADASLDSDVDALYAELEDSLEDLEEGLDVLMILEKAYEKTIQAHARDQDASSGLTEEVQDATIASVSNSTEPRNPSHGSASRSSSCADTSSPWTPIVSPNLSPITSRPPKASPLQGSSTALVAVLEHPRVRSRRQQRPLSLLSPRPRHVDDAAHLNERGAVIKIAHLGDCMGMLIRGEEIVWRTEEMWWNFNTPVQLGPSSPTRPRDAHVFTVPVVADDILILASDGLSDNLWDEDVLDEVVRFRRPYLAHGALSSGTGAVNGALGRTTLAAMLSEALCSRARRAAETRTRSGSGCSTVDGEHADIESEVPFARRAREQGRSFHGGKPDDISVLVAVVSPVESKGSS